MCIRDSIVLGWIRLSVSGIAIHGIEVRNASFIWRFTLKFVKFLLNREDVCLSPFTVSHTILVGGNHVLQTLAINSHCLFLCTVYEYVGKADLNNCYWNQKPKFRGTIFLKDRALIFFTLKHIIKRASSKCMVTPNFSIWINKSTCYYFCFLCQVLNREKNYPSISKHHK